jgi:MoaA/NifB/PqqE/SkfB family radical SAM enzyme
MPVATRHFLNLNYVCNERCVFCASDLTNAKGAPRIAKQISLETALAWLSDWPPQPGDRVLLAGGEPTLHPTLFEIVRAASADGAEVTLFTNGLRLADKKIARAAVESGIGRFEIALFGATAAAHDAITQVPGSFEKTILALQNLGALRDQHSFVLQVRLLVSKQSNAEGPAIVDLVHGRVRGVDEFSFNRLILSDHARGTEAAVSWQEARQPLNEAARLVLQYGYRLIFGAIPLCVFADEIAEHVRGETLPTIERLKCGEESSRWNFRYLDPYVAAGENGGKSSRSNLAFPDLCQGCDYLHVCGRVEDWYVERFGTQGLGMPAPSK